ncbi:MAG: VWA domain-containing protein [Candidatus Saccharimonadales bacterium]
MKFQSIAPWWIVVIAGLALCGFMAWQVCRAKRNKRLQFAWLRRLSIALLLTLMALGPSLPGASSPAGMINLDVMFAVDTTTSMGATDYQSQEQERLVGAKSDIKGIAEAMAGARFGIYTFDRETVRALPMTTDLSALSAAVDGIARENSNDSRGSSIDVAMSTLEQQFKDNKKRNEQRPQILFYLGDGEQTAEKAAASFAPLKKYLSGGAVLGYGTASGGKMVRFYGFSSLTDDPCMPKVTSSNCYVENFDTGDAGISKIDEKSLGTIASAMGLQYQNRNDGGSFERLVDTSGAQRVADGTREITSYSSLYYFLAFPLALLAAWELVYIKSRIDEIPGRKARRT